MPQASLFAKWGENISFPISSWGGGEEQGTWEISSCLFANHRELLQGKVAYGGKVLWLLMLETKHLLCSYLIKT